MSEPQDSELARIKEGKVYVAGHRGMVGRALVRRLESAGCSRLLLRTRAELDLTDQAQVHSFFDKERPDYVLWPPQRSVESSQIAHTRQNSSTRISP